MKRSLIVSRINVLSKKNYPLSISVHGICEFLVVGCLRQRRKPRISNLASAGQAPEFVLMMCRHPIFTMTFLLQNTSSSAASA